VGSPNRDVLSVMAMFHLFGEQTSSYF
jgi:hypothetical protein